jgi:hypothetical protein
MKHGSPLDSPSIAPQHPHEPPFIQYASEISGCGYDAVMVDHLADMLLIFYCAGGTAIGAVTGASLAISVVGHLADFHHAIMAGG